MISNIEETIIRKVDLQSYLEDKYGIRFFAGRSACPIHGGHNPTSFAIYNSVACCYSCGYFGNTIKFVQNMEKVDYFNAIKLLANEFGIKINETEVANSFLIHETYASQSAKFYKGNQYIEYLTKERHLSQQDIDLFNLGSEGTAITFPLRTLSGTYGGITRRNMHYEAEGKPKYKHTKGNELLEKGNYLYGMYESLSEIRKQRRVYITEGYFDCIAGNSQGIPTIAYCGSNITKGQIESLLDVIKDLLPRFSVYIVPDNDDKHYVNAFNMRERFRKYAPQLSTKIVFLPKECKDFSDVHVLNKKIEELATQTLDIFVLRGEIQKCTSKDEEYDVSKEIINQIKNELIKSDCVNFLADRWGKDSVTVSEWLKIKTTENDLLMAFKHPEDGLSELTSMFNSSPLNTGWRGVDDSIGPLYRGDVVILSARPACGKTWAGCQMALNLVRSGHKGILVSLEMSTAAIYQRIISMWSNIPISNIEHLTKYEEQINKTKQELKNNLFIVSDNEVCNTMDKINSLITFANQRMSEKGIDFVIIDYLQYLKGCSQYENLSQEANKLKPVAKENNILCVALAQLGRGVKASEQPSLENLRGAGEIEQIGDVVIGLWRPFLTGENGDPNIIMADFMKTRRGAKKYQAALKFNPLTYNVEG